MRIIRWAFLFSSFAVCVLAQDKAARIKVQHYSIDADVNPRTQSLSATVKIDFTPLDDAPSASFELNNALKISKIIDNSGHTLESTRNGDFGVQIAFPSALPKD
jgi:hypothetical protein